MREIKEDTIYVVNMSLKNQATVENTKFKNFIFFNKQATNTK